MDTATRASTSKRLYVFAWIVEIIAVVIGLGISLAVAYSGWEALTADQEVTASTYLNVLIAAAPFLLIAVVELTKIPLSGAAYYASRWYWKWLFAIALLFVAAVTFETMFNGLERQFASLKYSIDTKMDKLSNENEQRSDLVNQREEASKVTLSDIENGFNDRVTVLQENFNASIAAIDDKYRSDRAGTVNEYSEMLRTDVERLSSQLADIKVRQAEELRALSQNESTTQQQLISEQNSRRQSLEKTYQSLTAEIAGLREQYDAATFFEGTKKKNLERAIDSKTAEQSAVANQLQAMISGASAMEQLSSGREALMRQHSNEVAEVSANLEEARKSLAIAIADFESGKTSLNQQISSEKAPIIEEYEGQRSEAAAMRDRQLEDLKNREAIVAELNVGIAELNESITSIRGQINVEGRDNQVYRMAVMFYNKDNIADLTPSEIGTVGSVWFGSLAAIVAFTGILLALGSYAVRTEPKPQPDDPKDLRADLSKLLLSLRRLVVGWRKERRSPSIKYVEKKVEVPREIVRTQYVPLPVPPGEAVELRDSEEARADELFKVDSIAQEAA